MAVIEASIDASKAPPEARKFVKAGREVQKSASGMDKEIRRADKGMSKLSTSAGSLGGTLRDRPRLGAGRLPFGGGRGHRLAAAA